MFDFPVNYLTLFIFYSYGRLQPIINVKYKHFQNKL